jgi:basic amino acid/polyamine antiporter, APA family
VLVLRRTDPNRARPFRTPAVMVVAPISILGCIYLFGSLSAATIQLFVGWAIVGLIFYFAYSRSRSHVGRGLVETHELDGDVPPSSVPPID